MSADEGQRGDPMDAVEMANSMRNLATGARALYEQLLEEKFEAADALRLTSAWLAGIAGGKIG